MTNAQRKNTVEAGFVCSHTVVQRLDPLAAQYSEYHHTRVTKVREVPSRDILGIAAKFISCVFLAKQLHPNHREHVDDDEEHQGEVTKLPHAPPLWYSVAYPWSATTAPA